MLVYKTPLKNVQASADIILLILSRRHDWLVDVADTGAKAADRVDGQVVDMVTNYTIVTNSHFIRLKGIVLRGVISPDMFKRHVEICFT